jgi:hypothetical protein
MGGDRSCPSDCPLSIWADLSPTDRKAQRKAVAEKLYKQGFTMERIATQLDVSFGTVQNDLSNLSETDKSKSAKTETNPKGAGRPKGSGKPRKSKAKQADGQEAKIIALAQAGHTSEEIATEIGVSGRNVRRVIEAERAKQEAKAEPDVDRSELSLTAQHKFDLAVKQATQRLTIEIERRVRAEMREWLQKQLDQYNENARHYEKVLSVRRGIMSRVDYRSILSCLHPDRIQDEALKKRFGHAFNLFTQLEKCVLNERESPTKGSDLPKTVDELMKRKAAYQAQRKAERTAKRSGSNGVQR